MLLNEKQLAAEPFLTCRAHRKDKKNEIIKKAAGCRAVPDVQGTQERPKKRNRERGKGRNGETKEREQRKVQDPVYKHQDFPLTQLTLLLSHAILCAQLRGILVLTHVGYNTIAHINTNKYAPDSFHGLIDLYKTNQTTCC